MRFLRNLADINIEGSLSTRFRRKRFELFLDFISELPRPVSILDVGGWEIFWERMGFANDLNYQITLLNIHKMETRSSNIRSAIGDGRDMRHISDRSYDVVFSNSVIEHVGLYKDQIKFANEIQRAGKTFFMQTPNFWFPIEPHVIMPFFHWLPIVWRVWLLTHFSMGWYERFEDKKNAEEHAKSIRLLRKRELQKLFSNGIIKKEKLFGVTKSFVIHSKEQID